MVEVNGPREANMNTNGLYTTVGRGSGSQKTMSCAHGPPATISKVAGYIPEALTERGKVAM